MAGLLLMGTEDGIARHYERRLAELEERVEFLERNVTGDVVLGVRSIREKMRLLRSELNVLIEERKAIRYTIRGVLLVVDADTLILRLVAERKVAAPRIVVPKISSGVVPVPLTGLTPSETLTPSDTLVPS